jgi:hypothetical protein
MGNAEQAEREFREAFLRADQSMLYHLTRLALAGNYP